MSAQIFPDNWWFLPQDKYDECRIALRALLSKDLEDSLKDVSRLFYCFLEDGRKEVLVDEK